MLSRATLALGLLALLLVAGSASAAYVASVGTPVGRVCLLDAEQAYEALLALNPLAAVRGVVALNACT